MKKFDGYCFANHSPLSSPFSEIAFDGCDTYLKKYQVVIYNPFYDFDNFVFSLQYFLQKTVFPARPLN